MTVDEKEITTRDWYDFVGSMADVIPALHLGGEEATKELLEMCALTPKTSVLDVGCGSGHTACEIAEEYGSRVTGIDISEIMVAKAERRARRVGLDGLVEFRVADVFDLPFGDGSYDVALFESVLTPLPGDKHDALRETVRVLQPGGLVAVNESLIRSMAPREFLELAERHPAMHGLFTPESLKALLEESGLEIVEMSEVRSSGTPSMTKELGVGGMIAFMVKNYPRILWKLVTDPRFRRAASVDDKLSKFINEHGGYVLIVGRVPFLTHAPPPEG
jgi:ubiquinone/menaquinone biosynthesis C-methylase UbiE